MAETYVQVAPDSTGKQIRNLQVTTLQADGTVLTVLMQVVALADETGRALVPVSARAFDTWSTELLTEVQAIHELLQIVTKVNR